MDYTNYSADDFVMDDGFRKWILKPNEENTTFWQNWLKQHPEKAAEVEMAKAMMMEMEAINPTIVLPEDRSRRIWQAASAAFDRAERRKPFVVEWVRQNPIWSAAASIVLAVVAVWAIQFNLPTTQTITTAFGETKSVSLPDGSQVTLNSNSQLTFAKNWNAGENRETWLKGEAFFKVEKKPTTQAKFTVHTDDLSVEVLGTIFNVRQRRGHTQVALQEGKIKLQLHQKDTAYILQPGELATYSAAQRLFDLKKVKSEKTTSWKNGVLIFDGISLQEIAYAIEDNYGVKIEIQDSMLAKRRMRGAGPSDSLHLLFKALEETFNLTIIQKPNSTAYEFHYVNE